MPRTPTLLNFLEPHHQGHGVELCLPRLSGSHGRPLVLSATPGEVFSFPSLALAERDARSAMHVIRLITSAVSADCDLEFSAPEDFALQSPTRRLRVVFGSRSNVALPALLAQTTLRALVDFKFDDEWAIIGQDGRRFAMRDPSTLDRAEYSASTDYGVVARVDDAKAGAIFLIAGLGGRATEGGGRFLFECWRDLQRRFQDHDFAVVLRFAPPVDPARFEPVAWYHC